MDPLAAVGFRCDLHTTTSSYQLPTSSYQLRTPSFSFPGAGSWRSLFSPGLASFLLQHFARVPHTLLLVRIRLAQAADVGRHLSDELTVDTRHRDVGLFVD